jgi:hypothetical protein
MLDIAEMCFVRMAEILV